jgi:hypothetical protein
MNRLPSLINTQAVQLTQHMGKVKLKTRSVGKIAMSFVLLLSVLLMNTPHRLAAQDMATAATGRSKTLISHRSGVETSGGRAWITYGHAGCRDAKCTRGAWSSIAKTMGEGLLVPPRWIWKSQLVSPSEALVGGSAAFLQRFYLPADATRIRGQIQITADNAYTVFVNGQVIGRGDNWQTVHVFDIDVPANPTVNAIAVVVQNFPQPAGTPETNPAGLIYRATIFY